MIQSIGDLAMSFASRASNTRIRGELNTLAQELTTGRKSDLRAALSGDLAPVAVIERSLSSLTAYRTVTAEADLFATSMQTALGQFGSHIETLTNAAFALGNVDNPSLFANFGADANSRFQAMVGTLNSRVAGRALFAGTDTGSAAVASAALILDDLVASLPPGVDAQGVSDAVDAYFADGGAFETGRYLGSTTLLAPFRLTPDDSVSLSIEATAASVKASLAAAAKGALIVRNVLSGQPEQLQALVSTVARDLLGAGNAVLDLRAYVGTQEARIDSARTRNSAETASLSAALANLVAADPYETATRLQAVQTQLETFFTVTARLSRLNLTGYLR